MKKEKSKSLLKWLLVLPLLGIGITSFLFVKIFIDFEKDNFEQEFYKIKTDSIKANREFAQDKVNEIIKFVDTHNKLLKAEAQEESKRMIDFAYSTLVQTYKENQHLPKSEILKIIFSKLKSMRFFNDFQGYYFIFSMDGTCLMHPLIPEYEGKNFLTFQDETGREFIKEGIDFLNNNQEGVYIWEWRKTLDAEAQIKHGYLKKFEPLGIFIGTGRLESEILELTKKEIQKLLINMKYGEKGYIFAYDYQGNTVSHIKEDFIGVNRWNELVEGKYLIQDLVSGAKENPEGFFMRYVARFDPVTQKEAYKTSYIRSIPEFEWIVGTGVYHDDVLGEIEQKRVELDKRFNKSISKLVVWTTVLIIFMGIPSVIIFGIIKEMIEKNQNNLIEENEQTLAQKEQLVKALRKDALTELANKIGIDEKLEDFIKRAKRDNKRVGVLFADIDDFKNFNDTYGHSIGDLLLIEVAKRLKSVLRETDCAGRLGGDEFVLLVEHVETFDDISTIAQKLQNLFRNPIILENKEYMLSLSIGISMFPDDGEDGQSLINNADFAMYEAKKNGKDMYRFFEN